MAKRPVFIVNNNMNCFVDEVEVEFQWYSGFNISQKQKSIKSLHDNFNNNYNNKKILEISSKSPELLGVSLSAFNLKMLCEDGNIYSVENIFQAGKVFKDGTDSKDLLGVTPVEAKKIAKTRNLKELKCFDYFGTQWELEPKTMFYDWLYINAVFQNKELLNELIKYDAFTDIEFNPNKSFNCQARSAAIVVSLWKNNMLNYVVQSVDNYKNIVINKKNNINNEAEIEQLTLF